MGYKPAQHTRLNLLLAERISTYDAKDIGHYSLF